jgi:hypothetical protein
MPGAIAADTAGDDFASLFDKRLQSLYVFVIYCPLFVRAKPAKSFA